LLLENALALGSRLLPGAFDDPDFATASLALARTAWRSHFGRWHPRPAGPL